MLSLSIVQYFVLVILNHIHLGRVRPERDKEFEADVDDHDGREDACCGLECRCEQRLEVKADNDRVDEDRGRVDQRRDQVPRQDVPRVRIQDEPRE